MLFANQSRRPGTSPSGQGLVEYALILLLVAIVVFAALMILGPVIGNTFSSINQSLLSI
jgi:pilus assembly protein Flp/PilA